MNIKYLEAFSEFNGRAVAIFKFSDNEVAEAVLREKGHTPFTVEELFGRPGDVN